MAYLLRSGIEEKPSPFTVVGAQYYEPDTTDVLGAFVDEAWTGVGTGYADIQAMGVSKLKNVGKPLTEEQYKESPHHRPGIAYSRDLTEASAKALAEFHDEQEENAFIINHASTAQTVAGYTAAFTTGLFEPKNVATGVAASLALSPVIGVFARAASSLRRIMQIKQASGRYGAKAAIGGAEGMVAAAVAEPSNQYSAKILRQDYGMSDTLLNIGLSTVFGAGIAAAPSFIKDKWTRHKTRTPDIVMAELDMAVNQLATGRKVDVSVVEKAQLGEIRNKPVAEQAAAVESVVKYTETPEFKGRFEGSKVVDEQGAPLRAFHGTGGDFSEFQISGEFSRRSVKQLGEGIYFSPDAKLAGEFAPAKGGNIRPAYLDIKNPLELDPNFLRPGNTIENFLAQLFPRVKTPAELRDAIIAAGYDGIIAKGLDRNVKEIVVFSPNQIISPFGESKLPNLVAQVDAQNSKDVSKSITDTVDPKNDTAVDLAAAREVEEVAATDIATQESFDRYLEEIAFMKKEGLLSDDEIAAFTDAINSVNEKDLQAGYDSLLTCLTRG